MEKGQSKSSSVAVDLSEGFGERLLGQLLDRAHEMPPQLIAPLVAEEVRRIGGRDVSILLQCYEQLELVPLPGRGLVVGEAFPIDGSLAGEAFLRKTAIEDVREDGVRLYLPLLDGSDEVGVMALTLDTVGENDHRLLRRLAGLVADMVVTKGAYTDQFFQTRRRHPMSLPAEIQWSLLPPMSMTTPQVSVAGILEPAYAVAGDSLDYALNDDILHLAIIDAMGHGLNAAVLATVVVGAYRHARRADVGLAELYSFMDRAIDEQFGPDQFVTAQMMHLDIGTGHLQWVNAGHPAALLIRGHRVVQALENPGTLPVGFGGAEPLTSSMDLQKGDRVLFYTDGLVEEHSAGEEQFGEERMIDIIEHVSPTVRGVQHMARSLSHALKRERNGNTSDDATIFLVEWHGGTADHLATFDI
ncbi:PP2C family protein-serine/threonine phosphatase [Streptomyces tsukubensis]|uniref:Phosphatase n=1 Tax=Streptomyces tsukubensis TaxID=83656 RepID=A0A1V4ACK5_9ACTN|nr:GAF domain-containing SpoIIE family protein phosphatase [Streptomyces tsukubensis]OON81097.1 phosphatase [Streptomyces tsukubensis]QFR94933.1 SpoIIE family protein phosphatase [Streptomyces tsukubensis]